MGLWSSQGLPATASLSGTAFFFGKELERIFRPARNSLGYSLRSKECHWGKPSPSEPPGWGSKNVTLTQEGPRAPPSPGRTSVGPGAGASQGSPRGQGPHPAPHCFHLCLDRARPPEVLRMLTDSWLCGTGPHICASSSWLSGLVALGWRLRSPLHQAPVPSLPCPPLLVCLAQPGAVSPG